MAYDKSTIDAYGVFSDYIRMGRRAATTHGGEWKAKCSLPGCTSQNDALQMWPYRVPEDGGSVTNFWCRVCKKSGDIITFVALMDGTSNSVAAEKLGVAGVIGHSIQKREARMSINLDVAPGDTWAMAALSFARDCQNILWSEKGKPALEWLIKRGFTEPAIRQRGYGYNPIEDFRPLEEWDVHEGKTVWLPRGITIPWMINGTIWKISIRRGDADLKRDVEQGNKPRKYVPIKGGSNGLYRADMITPGQPLIMFEGELNADILAQVLATSDLSNVAIVATGSKDKGRADNWLVKIAKASPILISFDPDGPGAQAAKEHWSKVLPQAILWPSIGGDLNDMFLAGKDVVKWLKRGLKLAGADLVDPPVIPFTEESVQAKPILDVPSVAIRYFKLDTDGRGLSCVCSQCGKPATHYGHEATAYCDSGQCWEVELSWRLSWKKHLEQMQEVSA